MSDEESSNADDLAPEDEDATDTDSSPTPYYDSLIGAEELVGEWLLPACPRCGDPVSCVTSRGPHDHRASPCGCRLSAAATRRL